MRALVRTPVLLAVLALAACNREARIAVQVLRPGSTNPMKDVSHLRFRALDADGKTLSEKVSAVGNSKDTLTSIPAGVPVRLQVTGFNGAPPGGSIVSNGVSGQFTVPEDLASNPDPLAINVFLRPVESFSPVVTADEPAKATRLNVARAGHTATQIGDGRVLITGGFTGASQTQTNWTYHATAELLDLNTGLVELPDHLTMAKDGVNGGATTPRAFHSATYLPATDQVLVVGGEYADKPASSAPAMKTQQVTLLFDPTGSGGSGIFMVSTSRQPRSRHTATLERKGMAIIFGGIFWSGSPSKPWFVESAEWYDSTDSSAHSLSTTTGTRFIARSGHAAVSANSGQFVMLLAGAAVQNATDKAPALTPNAAQFFSYDGTQVNSLNNTLQFPGAPLDLTRLRQYSAAAEVGFYSGGKGKAALAGGFSDFSSSNPFNLFPATPSSKIDVITVQGPPTGPQVEQGGDELPLAVGQSCAVTLKDGRALVIGGRGGSPVASVSSTAVLSDGGAAVRATKGADMADRRVFHSCTLLNDGSVLVIGGVDMDAGSRFSTLDTMEIFMPTPAE